MVEVNESNLSPHAVDFIDDDRLSRLVSGPPPEPARVRDVLAKSMAKEALNLEETAALIRTADPALVEEIFASARQLKRDVYGNRIVLFAPLYIGNECLNECGYCAFRQSNSDVIRRTLRPDELHQQVTALEQQGHKRLILVFGEHPSYDAEFIAATTRQVYGIRVGHGEIRRVNINAAPFDHAGYRIIKEAGIGTYQIFQETYHHPTYTRYHPAHTRKGNYLWRLDGLSRAMEAGLDDVGLGVLFGLYDWRFELLGLISHARHLQKRYSVGPHTISFPRIRPACGVRVDPAWTVVDADFKRLIAILRLAVPYTGLILTARETPEIRRELLGFGVSQIDAGSRLELGGYTEAGDAQCMEREQFELGDIRSLDETIRQLLHDGFIPSFCTSCYRLNRTGEHFMEYAIPGFIQRFCTPNALMTLFEYLEDYASPETRAAGEALLTRELDRISDVPARGRLEARLARIRGGERDIYL